MTLDNSKGETEPFALFQGHTKGNNYIFLSFYKFVKYVTDF